MFYHLLNRKPSVQAFIVEQVMGQPKNFIRLLLYEYRIRYMAMAEQNILQSKAQTCTSWSSIVVIGHILGSSISGVRDDCYTLSPSGRCWINKSITDSSARVLVSPRLESPTAIFFKIRRMILPDLVFGRPGAYWMWSGWANGPILLRTRNKEKKKKKKKLWIETSKKQNGQFFWYSDITHWNILHQNVFTFEKNKKTWNFVEKCRIY